MSLISATITLHDDLSEAKRVLRLEQEGLEALENSLDHTLTQSIETILATTGRVVTSGMGKSGHVARKIAATLASTGTPAFFVHPAEASHGDLGMIAEDDILLLLSNSGETAELSDLINFAHRRQIPIIGVTQQPASSLAEMSNIALVIPKIEEACPHGLAPTTSTTVMMALGDALALCLLKRRGFSSKDFGSLHPGGKLGQRLVRVSKLMHTGDAMPIIPATTIMSEVILVMSQKGFGCVGLLDDQGGLIGIITDGDLRRHMMPNLLQQRAADVMTPGPLTVSSTTLAQDALALLNNKGRSCLFIVDDTESRKPLGVVHLHDFLRAHIA
ncbi:MAG: SIS domain-containing protein [Holosporales bacterium]